MTTYADYTEIEGGSHFDPKDFSFKKLLRTEYKTWPNVNGVFFKKYLYSGNIYPLGVETNYSQAAFGVELYDIVIKIWTPTDWENPDLWNKLENPTFEIDKWNNKDDGEHWGPYDYPLNRFNQLPYDGGKRYNINCTETGYWIIASAHFGYT